MQQSQTILRNTAHIYKAALGSQKNITDEEKKEAVDVTATLAGAVTVVGVWYFLTTKGIPPELALKVGVAAGAFVAFGVRMVGPKVLDKVLDTFEKKDKKEAFGKVEAKAEKGSKRPLAVVRKALGAPAVC